MAQLNLPRITPVAVVLPCKRFSEWEQLVRTTLQIDPDRETREDRQFVASNVKIEAPRAVHLDCDQAAREIGWTKDQLMSLLVIYGLMYLIRYGGLGTR